MTDTQKPSRRKLKDHYENWGGKREGAGFKPIYSEAMVIVTARMTKEQRDKLKALGGAAWIRDRIDEAVLSDRK